jgi:hypothetical protein
MTFIKFNLKNFPTESNHICPNCEEPIILVLSDVQKEWFEGFEKEVRQMLEEQKNNPEAFYAKIERIRPRDRYVSESILKEILGE